MLVDEKEVGGTGVPLPNTNTNNVAEYNAVFLAFAGLLCNKDAFTNLHKAAVELHSDSQLVVKQLNGEYKVRNKVLKGYYNSVQYQLKNLKDLVKSVEIKWVPRKELEIVDKMNNYILDQEGPAVCLPIL
jgi:ribonuclease HI